MSRPELSRAERTVIFNSLMPIVMARFPQAGVDPVRFAVWTTLDTENACAILRTQGYPEGSAQSPRPESTSQNHATNTRTTTTTSYDAGIKTTTTTPFEIVNVPSAVSQGSRKQSVQFQAWLPAQKESPINSPRIVEITDDSSRKPSNASSRPSIFDSTYKSRFSQFEFGKGARNESLGKENVQSDVNRKSVAYSMKVPDYVQEHRDDAASAFVPTVQRSSIAKEVEIMLAKSEFDLSDAIGPFAVNDHTERVTRVGATGARYYRKREPSVGKKLAKPKAERSTEVKPPSAKYTGASATPKDYHNANKPSFYDYFSTMAIRTNTGFKPGSSRIATSGHDATLSQGSMKA
eukprot:Clim_evm11s164 gene=Clim_evmTU11s164